MIAFMRTIYFGRGECFLLEIMVLRYAGEEERGKEARLRFMKFTTLGGLDAHPTYLIN